MQSLTKKILLLTLILVCQHQMIRSSFAVTIDKLQPSDTIINKVPQVNRPTVVEQDLHQSSVENNINKQSELESLTTRNTKDAKLVAVLQLMKKQKWQEAKQLLAPEVSKKTPNMHLLFLAGQVAERLANYQEAMSYYRQMLATDSNLPRPRFELARMQYQLKKMQQAEKNFRLVLAQSPPKPVVTLIERYLTAIRKQKVSWQVGFNILPSTNVNNGSNNDTIIINGKEFVLSDDAKAQSGIGLQGVFAGQYQFGNELQWFVDGVLQHTDYAKKTNDSTFLRSRVGHTWRRADNRIKTSLGYQGMRHQHKPLYTGWVTSVNYQKELTQKTTLNTTLEWQKLNYVEDYDYLDATQTWLNLNLNYYKNGNTMYQYGVRAGKNKTDDPSESYDNIALEFGAVKQFNWYALTTNVGAVFDTTKYDAKRPFSNVKRQDKKWKLSAGVLKRDWSWWGFTPKISIQHENNASNIPLYEHKKTNVNVEFTQNF